MNIFTINVPHQGIAYLNWDSDINILQLSNRLELATPIEKINQNISSLLNTILSNKPTSSRSISALAELSFSTYLRAVEQYRNNHEQIDSENNKSTTLLYDRISKLYETLNANHNSFLEYRKNLVTSCLQANENEMRTLIQSIKPGDGTELYLSNKALKYNNLTLLKILLEKEFPKEHLFSLIEKAMEEKKLDFLTLLVPFVDFEFKNKCLINSLGKIEVVKFFLNQEGVSPNTRDDNGWSPLLYAALNDDLDSATLLIQSRADVNAANSNQSVPLHFASILGSEKFLRLLLEAGANKNLQDNLGKTSLDWARDTCFTVGIELLS